MRPAVFMVMFIGLFGSRPILAGAFCLQPSILAEISAAMLTSSRVSNFLSQQEIKEMGTRAFCDATWRQDQGWMFFQSEKPVPQEFRNSIEFRVGKTLRDSRSQDSSLLLKELESLNREYDQFGARKNLVTDSELSGLIKSSFDRLICSDFWMCATFPDARVRKTALDRKTERLSGMATGQRGALDRVFNKCKSIPIYTSDKEADANQSSLATYTDQNEDIAQAGKKAGFVCASYGVSSARGCQASLERIVKTYAPRGDNMALPVVSQTLQVSPNQKVACAIGLKLLKRIENPLLPGNLWDDLLDAAISSGLDRKAAEEHTWNLIATWASRGPNVDQLAHFTRPDSQLVLAALDLLGSAAPYLDQVRLEAGSPQYSYPKVFSSKCAYGKSYHFWMAAFLSWKMAKETGSPDGAMKAAYLTEVGYNMRSNTSGRDPLRAFQIDVFSPFNNKMRTDVAFGTAGAVYGRIHSEGRQANVDIDQSIMEMVNDAELVPRLTSQESEDVWSGMGGLEGYLRWKKVFAPDSALENLSKQAGF